jgi:predicted adenine nucleotide alpha hydrolase (AANH) superfamily ATPase
MMKNSSPPALRTSQKKTEADPPGVSTIAGKKKPMLLLHVCCGPCSTHVIDVLRDTYHPIGFFYNPNLHPKEEYYKRLEAAARVCRASPSAFWIHPFGQGPWLVAVRGFETEAEGGKRCQICVRHRLEVTAWVAKATSMQAFGTTLTISPNKKSNVINEIGNDLSKSTGVPFLSADFKKKDGFLKSVQKSKDMDLYRQDYCGCCYSMRERSPSGR